MKKERSSSEELNVAFDQLSHRVVEARIPLLRQAADRQADRAKRMRKIWSRLKEELGEDNPRVIALDKAANKAEGLEISISKAAIRESRRPKINPGEYMVFGTVIDAKGEPVPGMRARVYDKDRRYDDLLGEAETDEYGDFYIKYHERMFMEMGEELPELYVMIEDQGGKLLYSSKDSIRRSASQTSYYKITL